MRFLMLALMFAGCQSETAGTTASRQVALPRSTPEAAQIRMLALLSGTLSLDGQCLYVTASEGDTRYFIVWPPSASIIKTPTDSNLHVFDRETGDSIPIRFDGGSYIVLGGGEVGDRRPERGGLDYPIPEECSGPYWIASSVSDKMPPSQPPPPNPPPPVP